MKILNKFEEFCSFQHIDEMSLQENLVAHFKYILTLKQFTDKVMEWEIDTDMKKETYQVYLDSIKTFIYKIEYLELVPEDEDLTEEERKVLEEFKFSENLKEMKEMVNKLYGIEKSKQWY